MRQVLTIKDGETLLLKLKGREGFKFDLLEDGESLQINASELLIVTPKAVKWYRAFKWLVKKMSTTWTMDWWPEKILEIGGDNDNSCSAAKGR